MDEEWKKWESIQKKNVSLRPHLQPKVGLWFIEWANVVKWSPMPLTFHKREGKKRRVGWQNNLGIMTPTLNPFVQLLLMDHQENACVTFFHKKIRIHFCIRVIHHDEKHDLPNFMAFCVSSFLRDKWFFSSFTF